MIKNFTLFLQKKSFTCFTSPLIIFSVLKFGDNSVRIENDDKQVKSGPKGNLLASDSKRQVFFPSTYSNAEKLEPKKDTVFENMLIMHVCKYIYN